MIPILTIAIPTYNRPEQLKNTLSIIIPQIKKDQRVTLLILDNHSEIPVKQIFIQEDLSFDRVQIIRNAYNIGGTANIMRCFELCETDWIWVLGDDDFPTKNAVEVLLEDTQYSHCYAYYSVPYIKKPLFYLEDSERVEHIGFESLMNRFNNEIELMAFLSAAVFNMKKIRPYLIEGYSAANTGVPHLFMMFKALSQGESWMISKKIIADYNPPNQGEGWGFMTIAFAMPCLLGMTSSRKEIKLIREYMIRSWRISPKKILYSLIYKYRSEKGEKKEIQFLFKTIQQLYAPSWGKDPMLRLRWYVTAIWACFPNFFAKWYKKKKEGKAKIMLVNDERR